MKEIKEHETNNRRNRWRNPLEQKARKPLPFENQTSQGKGKSAETERKFAENERTSPNKKENEKTWRENERRMEKHEKKI